MWLIDGNVKMVCFLFWKKYKYEIYWFIKYDKKNDKEYWLIYDIYKYGMF